MFRVWCSLAAVALGCLAAFPLRAEDTTEPVAVLRTPHPMAAVGLLSIDGTGMCTGTLIAPDVVLTAAHCVQGTSAEGDIGRLSFRTGAYPGALPVEESARDVVIHPLYPGSQDRNIERRTGFDIALVRLAQAIPATSAVPLRPTKDAVADPRLLLASYRGGTGDRARERTCPVIEASDRMIRMGCDVRQGESGSPVLQRSGDSLVIVGVLSARGEDGPQKLAMAAGSVRIGQLQALMGVNPDEP